MDVAPSLTLKNGACMPLVGLGTWMSGAGDVASAVSYAIGECGYRHIDCARAYDNEEEVGKGLASVFSTGSVRREDMFITSKLPNMAHRPEDVLPTCKETLSALGTDYLDLYLMHWGLATDEGHREPKFIPVSIRETWEAMQELVRLGLVRSLGVANFTAPMLIDLMSYANVAPEVNQIELHPYLQQPRLVEFCRKRGVAVTAYSPLGRPGAHLAENFPRITDDLVIKKIAAKHGKTAGQVILRWGVQRETVVIPKSTHPERIRENFGIFDFELSDEEMAAVADLDRHLRLVDPYIWADVPYFD